MNEKIEYILQLIQTIFKSEKDKHKIDRLHIANSQKYVQYILKKNMSLLYNTKLNEINENILTMQQLSIYQTVKTSRNLIDMYSVKIYEYAEEMEVLKKLGKGLNQSKFTWNYFLTPEEIFVANYKYDSKPLSGETGNSSEDDSSKPIDVNDVNLNSYLSTISFVDLLCSICEEMKNQPIEDQMGFLRKRITEINKVLPANVYLPFLKDSIRNYLICHIPVTEMKIFRTKNRAPYMITVEVIRIDEIISELYKKEIKEHPKQDITHIEIERGRSLSIGVERNKTNNTIEKENNNYTISYPNKNKVGQVSEVRKRSSTALMLVESDIKLSKPVIISNLEADKKRAPMRSQNKIILEETDENEESFIKDDMNSFVKRRLTDIQQNSYRKKHSKTFSGREELKSNMILESKKDEDVDNQIKIKTKASNDIPIAKEKPEDEKKIEGTLSETSIENFFSTCEEYCDVFGELFEVQKERIKATSPFGHLDTWNIFKMIVKSGEDLRQEQFATQLINEFNQIFRLEKVKCWVNPYEIIATGNNVGLIEMVPNSISIDQLKRKIGNKSLRHFFENYFGPVEGKRFKKAMNNFIKSLAGYSLVCYFLQIKDRHNANILLDNLGHVIHIDFGFLLSNAPGKGIKFEKAPFKLTGETVECMGGVNSKYFTKFRKLLWKGFLAIVKHSEKITILVEMMFCGHGKNLPCFQNKEATLDDLKARFYPKPNMKAVDYMRHVDSLIEQSTDNWRTRWYDRFQYYFQGIFY